MALLAQKLWEGKKLSKSVFGYFKTKKKPAIKRRTFFLFAASNILYIIIFSDRITENRRQVQQNVRKKNPTGN